MEYGFSCMGYEVAGAMGIKMAAPGQGRDLHGGRRVYMMANSELATAVMMGIPFTVVLTDNRGYGCINRLQMLDRARRSTTFWTTAITSTRPISTLSPMPGRWGPMR